LYRFIMRRAIAVSKSVIFDQSFPPPDVRFTMRSCGKTGVPPRAAMRCARRAARTRFGGRPDCCSIRISRRLKELRVDGAAALGAALLAGLQTGFWPDVDTVARQWRERRRFHPALEADQRAKLIAGWQRAVERSRDWAREV
jgi:hypothetical protein